MQNESPDMSENKSCPIVSQSGEDQVEREQQGVSSTAEVDRADGALTDRNKGVVVVVDTRPLDHQLVSPLTNEHRMRMIRSGRQVARSLPPLDTTRLLTVLIRDVFLTSDEGLRVVECIQRRYVRTKTPIMSFRARNCVLNGKDWPILEWKEGPNVEVTAVVMIECGNLPLSCLLVCGIGLDSRGSTKRYDNTSLEWVAANADHLKELFPVARFWLGAVHWPRSDRSRMLGEDSVDYANQQYCPSFELLMKQI
jgi:hypothetical protein